MTFKFKKAEKSIRYLKTQINVSMDCLHSSKWLDREHKSCNVCGFVIATVKTENLSLGKQLTELQLSSSIPFFCDKTPLFIYPATTTKYVRINK